jgi:hypothetical protein
METKTKDNKTTLFLSVDNAYKRNDLVNFTYLPCFEDQARSFLASMVPYMLHTYQDTRISEYFTTESCERAKDTEWDDANNEVISKDDKYVDSLFDCIDDWEEMGTEPINLRNDSTHEKNRTESLFLGEETDSVGTLQSRSRLTKISEYDNGVDKVPTVGRLRDDTNNCSNTIGSSSTRLTSTDQSILELSQAFTKLCTKMETLTVLQDTNTKVMLQMQERQELLANLYSRSTSQSSCNELTSITTTSIGVSTCVPPDSNVHSPTTNTRGNKITIPRPPEIFQQQNQRDEIHHIQQKDLQINKLSEDHTNMTLDTTSTFSAVSGGTNLDSQL